MNKKKQKRSNPDRAMRLALARETLRRLEGSDLRVVVGATAVGACKTYFPVGCPTQ
jgi:hypothetical protein